RPGSRGAHRTTQFQGLPGCLTAVQPRDVPGTQQAKTAPVVGGIVAQPCRRSGARAAGSAGTTSDQKKEEPVSALKCSTPQIPRSSQASCSPHKVSPSQNHA